MNKIMCQVNYSHLTLRVSALNHWNTEAHLAMLKLKTVSYLMVKCQHAYPLGHGGPSVWKKSNAKK